MADLLGLDQSRLSRIEANKRTIRGRDQLLDIARTLEIPPGALGVTPFGTGGLAEVDYENAASVVTLARATRILGNPALACAEIQPLLNRLDAEIDVTDPAARDVALLVAEAHLVLGLVLGDLVPEHAIGGALRHLLYALSLAEGLGVEPAATGYIQSLIGTQQRIAGRNQVAQKHIQRAYATAPTSVERGTYAAVAAETAAAAHEAELFRTMIKDAKAALDEDDQRTALFSETAVGEIEARGLIDLDRPSDALAALDGVNRSRGARTTPQWTVISLVTQAEAHAAMQQPDAAVDLLAAALADAFELGLPHQVQRAYRLLAPLESRQAQGLFERADHHLRQIDMQLAL
jgi:hypothetical protein